MAIVLVLIFSIEPLSARLVGERGDGLTGSHVRILN